MGDTGAQGARGIQGEQGVFGINGTNGVNGEIGPTGPAGVCNCSCTSSGQLVNNGTMEQIVNNKPSSWTYINPNDVTSINALGRVHSGSFSVNLSNGAGIEQVIPITNGGCYYDFSFFARGEGSQVGFNATITFNTPSGDVSGGSITVRQQDLTDSNRDYTYFRLITTKAPLNTTSITIRFLVNSTGGQSLDLDDVSLIVS